MKMYRVFQTISIFVEAKNEVEAVEKVRSDEDTYRGWHKWDIEEIEWGNKKDDCDSIIDFYPPLNCDKE